MRQNEAPESRLFWGELDEIQDSSVVESPVPVAWLINNLTLHVFECLPFLSLKINTSIRQLEITFCKRNHHIYTQNQSVRIICLKLGTTDPSHILSLCKALLFPWRSPMLSCRRNPGIKVQNDSYGYGSKSILSQTKPLARLTCQDISKLCLF